MRFACGLQGFVKAFVQPSAVASRVPLVLGVVQKVKDLFLLFWFGCFLLVVFFIIIFLVQKVKDQVVLRYETIENNHQGNVFAI